MGAWGTGIFQDDDSLDIRAMYYEQLSVSSDEEAEQFIFDKIYPDYKDSDNESIFWFGLALAQWKKGRLTEVVKQKALEFIENGKDLEIWNTPETQKDLRKRKTELEKLKDTLLSQQPERKKFKPKKPVYSPWKVGDLLTYKINHENPEFNNKYVLLRVIDISKHRMSQHINPEEYFYEGELFGLYNWCGDEIPDEDITESLDFLKVRVNVCDIGTYVFTCLDHLNISSKDWGKYDVTFLGNRELKDKTIKNILLQKSVNFHEGILSFIIVDALTFNYSITDEEYIDTEMWGINWTKNTPNSHIYFGNGKNIIGMYEELLAIFSDEKSEQMIIDAFYTNYKDKSYESIFWLALGRAEFEYGRLSEKVKHKVFEWIEKWENQHVWGKQSEIKDRKRFWEELKNERIQKQKQYFLSEQPEREDIEQINNFFVPWKTGDLIAYKIKDSKTELDNRYALLRVVKIHRHPVGYCLNKLYPDTYYYEIAYFVLYNWIDDNIPNNDIAENLDFLVIKYDNDCKVNRNFIKMYDTNSYDSLEMTVIGNSDTSQFEEIYWVVNSNAKTLGEIVADALLKNKKLKRV